mmetsp:Transcript_24317/g.76507  ORF Transcript_24317/g.76507 Transcript_24317/m.76507 type:complete len:303 (+) Transcript_24317:34-942(+)
MRLASPLHWRRAVQMAPDGFRRFAAALLLRSLQGRAVLEAEAERHCVSLDEGGVCQDGAADGAEIPVRGPVQRCGTPLVLDVDSGELLAVKERNAQVSQAVGGGERQDRVAPPVHGVDVLELRVLEDLDAQVLRELPERRQVERRAPVRVLLIDAAEVRVLDEGPAAGLVALAGRLEKCLLVRNVLRRQRGQPAARVGRRAAPWIRPLLRCGHDLAAAGEGQRSERREVRDAPRGHPVHGKPRVSQADPSHGSGPHRAHLHGLLQTRLLHGRGLHLAGSRHGVRGLLHGCGLHLAGGRRHGV